MFTSSKPKKPGWFERRRNRLDAAVIGALLQGDRYFLDIQRRIGGGSSTIYPALTRLENRQLVARVPAESVRGRVHYVLRHAHLTTYIATHYDRRWE